MIDFNRIQINVFIFRTCFIIENLESQHKFSDSLKDYFTNWERYSDNERSNMISFIFIEIPLKKVNHLLVNDYRQQKKSTQQYQRQ